MHPRSACARRAICCKVFCMSTRAVIRLQLTKGKSTIIDRRDWPLVKHWKWSALRTKTKWYAVRGVSANGKVRMILMHREIMHAKTGITVDHIDRNGLNNRRRNLRLATYSQQQMNRRAKIMVKGKRKTSRYKGVWWCNAWGRNRAGWFAGITILGHQYMQRVDSQREGARVYDALALKHFGAFARGNFTKRRTPRGSNASRSQG